MTPRNLAVGYIRASTDDQELTLEAQDDAILEWCKKNNLTLVGNFLDHGISGGAQIADRPGLLKALGACSDPNVTTLVAAKRDRFARDVVIAAQIETIAAKYDVVVRTADGASDGDSATAAFMKTITDAVSQYERAKIRERTREALAVKKQRGECVGHIPYGFERNGKTLVPNKAEQYNLNRIKYLRERGYSASTVSEILAADGRFNRNGKQFCVSDIYRLQAGTRRAKVGVQ